MLQQVCGRVYHMERAKASAHMDGSGLQHGMDMCGFRQHPSWLSRKDLHDQAGIVKATAGGSLWPQKSATTVFPRDLD